MPVTTVRAMVKAGYVAPIKGVRGALRYTLQDLIMLRTARGLLAAHISPRRIGQALRLLHRQLPDAPPLGGYSVTAVGDRVAVHMDGQTRDALSGQVLMSFDVRSDGGSISIVDAATQAGSAPAGHEEECERAFESALALESDDVEAAIDAYRSCVAKHAHNGARANLGRILHLRGRVNEAIELYEAAPDPDADLLYNLGVALEDTRRLGDAIVAYRRALKLDEQFADAHHNLARLLAESGQEQQALRHWSAYRRLAAARRD